MSALVGKALEGIRRKREKGFTLIEVLVTTAMLAGVLGAVTLGLQACHDAADEMERKAIVTRTASQMMDRLFMIDFGTGTDAPPSDAQLTELFDEDDDLGTATLTTLRLAVDDPGYQFTLGNFPYPGIWEVRVGTDLDLDGDETDNLEGEDDIVRMDIYYEGVLMLSSMRSAEVS